MIKLSIAVLLLATAVPTLAVPLILDSGWQEDNAQATNANSDLSPYTFTLTTKAFFRVTDAYLPGDTYHIVDTGNAIDVFTTFTTDGAIIPDYHNAAWTDTSFSRSSLTLNPGTYSIFVSGDCAEGCPAGLGVRLDTATVPEPASWALLLVGFGMVGTALRRRNAAISA